MTDIVQIQFTIDDQATADHISRRLLEERLVACAQRSSPILSRYWWHDKLEESTEWLVTMKTQAALSEAVVKRIGALHSYETPEVLVVAVVGGSEDYLDWVAVETARR